MPCVILWRFPGRAISWSLSKSKRSPSKRGSISKKGLRFSSEQSKVRLYMPILEEISGAVQTGNAPKTKSLVEKGLGQGLEPWSILNDGMAPALDILGEQLRDYTISLPEIMISVGAVRAGLSILKPLLINDMKTLKGVVIMGTVQGDVHSLGKDIVIMMLEGNGFHVVDLGADVPPSHFVEACLEHKANIVAMSGLITISKLIMGNIIRAFENAGMREQISIMVGGGSVDALSARAMGADAYGEDASIAPQIALKVLKKKFKKKSRQNT